MYRYGTAGRVQERLRERTRESGRDTVPYYRRETDLQAMASVEHLFTKLIQKTSLDFETYEISKSKTLCGYLDRKISNQNGKYDSNYFVLLKGSLYCYENGPDDGDLNYASQNMAGLGLIYAIPLTGATVTLYNKVLMTIITSQYDEKMNVSTKKRQDIALKGPTSDEANEWFRGITEDIERLNAISLNDNVRIPEVVEWYYRKQSELTTECEILNTEIPANFFYLKQNKERRPNAPSASGQFYCRSNIFIQATSSHNGIILRFSNELPGGGLRKLDMIENIYNGREILLSEIVSITVLPTSSNRNQIMLANNEIVDNRNKILLKLSIKEGDMLISVEESCALWFDKLYETGFFLSITQPSSTSAVNRVNNTGKNSEIDKGSTIMTPISNSHQSSSTPPSLHQNRGTLQHKLGFNTNSGAVFGITGDVAMYLSSMREQVRQSLPIIRDLSDIADSILHIIGEVKCNKQAASEFGVRLEDVVRVLADPNTGIIYIVKKPEDIRSVSATLSILLNKLKELHNFLNTEQVQPGWFRLCMHPNASIRAKYNTLDNDIIVLINSLINKYGDKSLLFIKKDYECVVDVRKSVDAFGGVDAVYNDAAKTRALARLIQADGSDVLQELISLSESLQHPEHRLSQDRFENISLDDTFRKSRSSRLSGSDRLSYSLYTGRKSDEKVSPIKNWLIANVLACFTCCKKATTTSLYQKSFTTPTVSRKGMTRLDGDDNYNQL